MERLEAGDGRGRQGKKDEQLRRRIEADMSKRKRQVGHQKQLKSYKGSVMTLKPDAPVTMEATVSVFDAAQYMCAKRASCILVLNPEGAVEGIFTPKDIAFKVVAARQNPRKMTVRDIMTPDPLCAQITTSAIDALDLMVSRGFRHLPVLDGENDIAGVLDITKCFYEAMLKLDRAYESSKKLFDALEGVKSEFGVPHASQLVSYVQVLRDQTSGPSLEAVIDPSKAPIFVDVRMTVAEASALMKENRTTAVLVSDKSAIIGIFTSKDVVMRVVAAGLDPTRVSVVRVMTPQPDSAPANTPIHEALRKMHEGHYLNLPVMDVEDNSVIGVIDVLRLTYATLEQLKGIHASNPDEEGPAWNKFWMSLDETDSIHSGPVSDFTGATTAESVTPSELAQFSMNKELAPEDSLSRTGFREPSLLSESTSIQLPAAHYFKFKAPNNRVHLVQVRCGDSLENVRQAIASKLSSSDLDTLGGVGEIEDGHAKSGFAISYIDDDGDLVAIVNDQDVQHAFDLVQTRANRKIDIHVHHSDVEPVVKQDLNLPIIVGGIVAAVAILAIVFRPKK